MKKLKIAALAFLASIVLSASAEEGENLLSENWTVIGKSTELQDDGIIFCHNKRFQKSGVHQFIPVHQTEPAPIYLSAESKAEGVGFGEEYTYCIFIDITHKDNTHTYGILVGFKPGTHDWEKAEKTFTPEKPAWGVTYYLFFNRPGKVWFRNPVLESRTM